ncbi:MAG: FAD-dependent oxidoreductase, partial [Bacillota bacterium]|nr:FAD-dependent oxidoreductase [Bacillota bacterium]
ISGEAIDNDIKLVLSAGVRVITGKEIESVSDLKKDYDYVILAVGASEPGTLKLERGETVNALEFLEEFKKNNGRVDIGKNVVVIGGGNTAMDTARAAKRTAGVNKVSLVYRRTKRYMPADEEELALAVDDCVEFLELLSPVTHKNGVLTCKKMALGEPGNDGRRAVAEIGETVSIEADTIIAAVGEKIPSRFYGDNGVNTASVDKETMETPVKGIFVIGDGLNGPATVVEAIRDARKASDAILDSHGAKSFDKTVSTEAIYDKRGRLAEEDEKICEVGRCLSCSSVCESCSEVCPNRANISVKVPGMEKNQIVHVDYMCNECGNCRSFCPYEGAPYLDKFTLFANEADMKNSKNEGFTVIDRESGDCKVRLKGEITDYKCGVDSPYVPKDIGRLIEAVASGYKNLI